MPDRPAPLLFVLSLRAGSILLLPTAGSGAPLPVGYDHPESDCGGPTIATGFARLDEVWPHRLVFAGKLPGGGPTRDQARTAHDRRS